MESIYKNCANYEVKRIADILQRHMTVCRNRRHVPFCRELKLREVKSFRNVTFENVWVGDGIHSAALRDRNAGGSSQSKPTPSSAGFWLFFAERRGVFCCAPWSQKGLLNKSKANIFWENVTVFLPHSCWSELRLSATKKPSTTCLAFFAERRGFEPRVPFRGTLV